MKTANVSVSRQGTQSAKKPATAGVQKQGMYAPAAKKGTPITRHGTTAGTPGKAVAYANRWRENYNPLRQLTIRRAVELLEAGQRGDTALLQWTYRFVEQTHPTLVALLTRCESPLLNFDWKVAIKTELPEVPGKSPEQVKAMAEEQQKTLRTAYEGLDNLKDAIKHLHLAEFRGYGHLQKHRTNDGDVYHLEPLDQWCVCRDGLYGDWFWNPDSQFVTNPVEVLGETNRIGSDQLPREDFIIREVDRPIDRVALINFIRANLVDKDWDGFIEIYGIPGGVVVMPPNVPQGKESEYEAAAKQVAEGGSGAIPNGADYKANDGPRGVDPFTPRARRLDEQLVMVGTGGKLTMLSESGSGTLAGGAHSDTFQEIADGRAQKISERFQRDFDAEILERDHPGEPALVYFKLGAADQDSKEVDAFRRDITKGFLSNQAVCMALAKQLDLKELLTDAGLIVHQDVDASEILDEQAEQQQALAQAAARKANDPEEPEDAPPVKNRSAKTNSAPSDELIESGVEHYAAALAQDLEIVRQRLAALEQISDDDLLRQRALDLAGDMDRIQADITKLPKAAQALAQIMAAGLMTGLTEKIPGLKNRRVLNGDVPGHDFHGNQYTEAAAAEQRSLRTEADRAHHAAHVVEFETPGATDDQIAEAHQTASEKYAAAAKHVSQFSGTRGSARLLRQKARDHKSDASFYANKAKATKEGKA